MGSELEQVMVTADGVQSTRLLPQESSPALFTPTTSLCVPKAQRSATVTLETALFVSCRRSLSGHQRPVGL